MIRTRFAPSPTGFLHIGNVRTAIFNYLFARHHGGEFLLRIEDTDKERSTQEAIDVIFEGLNLMGLEHDGEVVMQSTRAARHMEVAQELLKSGNAYKCFCTVEELDAMKNQARSEGRPPRYNRKWRDVPESEHPDLPYTIRIKAPDDGETVINDLVQGEVRVANSEMDDMIIVRADGTPVYQLAVVVDDHDAGVTHVIRGDDHLTNTFRQIMILNGMGWEIPTYGHLPLIMDERGRKISKRTGAASIVDFIELGYLPETMLNYLCKLGWSNEKEFLSKEELIALFDFDHVGRAASRLDYKKLGFINSHWISEADTSRLMKFIKIVHDADTSSDKIDIEQYSYRLMLAIPSAKVRVKTIRELIDLVSYIDNDFWEKTTVVFPESFSNFNWKRILLEMLEEIKKDDVDLMAFLKAKAEESEVKLRDVAQMVRYVLCKSKISPPLDDVINSIGYDETESRCNKFINGE